MNVFWPPGYYILRDRIPFFLTIIYFHRNSIPKKVQEVIGWYLFFATIVVTGVASMLYLMGESMVLFSGINWSPASPIEWGLFIITSTLMLYTRKIEMLESFYVSFIAAMGGGWLYECHGWILNPNLMAFLKINAVKVFFMEFQLFCIPIIFYLINSRLVYKKSIWVIPVTVFGVLFYAATPWIKTWYPIVVGYYAYRWIIRVPTILWLFALLYGIKGERKDVACGDGR